MEVLDTIIEEDEESSEDDKPVLEEDEDEDEESSEDDLTEFRTMVGTEDYFSTDTPQPTQKKKTKPQKQKNIIPLTPAPSLSLPTCPSGNKFTRNRRKKRY